VDVAAVVAVATTPVAVEEAVTPAPTEVVEPSSGV
jgi:hypothetical protein